MDQENTPTRKTLWIFAVIGVLIYALIFTRFLGASPQRR